MSPEKSFKCRQCKQQCIKKGIRNNIQKWFCKSCCKYQQRTYAPRRRAIQNKVITLYIKEGLGIRSIGRLLHVSPATVINRVIGIAKLVKQPVLQNKYPYELDEIHTYIGCKTNPIWIAYAMNNQTYSIACFKVGRRNLATLGNITDILTSHASKIFTDKLSLYRTLIPNGIHSTKLHGTNHIERNHLTLRTHLKRLNRKTICFSRSVAMLSACLKIYFWG